MRTCATWMVCCAMLMAVPALADETWPQFRGPDGQGHASDRAVPVTWSDTENVRWRTPLAGRGWSSPVLLEGRIWMTTAIEETGSLRVLCLDQATGRSLHDVEVFRVEKLPFRNLKNSYASPTAVVEPGRVYVHFGTLGTACLDTGSGSILWRNEEVKLDHKEGPGSSPALWHGLLLINCDGIDIQEQVALDKATGKIAWRTPRSGQLKDNTDLRKAYSTPLVVDVGGRELLISTGADWVYAYDPATGREVWRIAYDGYSNVPRPIFGHDHVFISTGYNSPQLWALRPDGTGDVTASHVAWRVTEQVPTIPSPILVGDELYMVTNNGVAACLDAHTGTVHWRKRLGGDFSASPILAGGRLYFANEKGETFVVEPGRELHLVATNVLPAGCFASPAAVDGALYLRTETEMVCIAR